MTIDRWKEVRQKIIDSFEVLDRYEEDLEPGTAEVIEFATPQGDMRASFITRPKVLDKKTLYSNRAGGEVKVDYVYSDDELVSHLEVKRWDEAASDWSSIDSGALF